MPVHIGFADSSEEEDTGRTTAVELDSGANSVPVQIGFADSSEEEDAGRTTAVELDSGSRSRGKRFVKAIHLLLTCT